MDRRREDGKIGSRNEHDATAGLETVNQQSVHFRLVLEGPRPLVKRSVVRRIRSALGASGSVGRLRIEPCEKYGERNTVVWGTLMASAPLERIVMRLAHGDWLFSLQPDDRSATWDVRRTPLGADSAITRELLWAHFQRRRDTRAYQYVGPVERSGSDRPASKLHRKHRSIAALVQRLRLRDRGWSIMDNWDADLCAVGIAHAGRPRRLVYVSTWNQRQGRFWYECETPTGRGERDFEVVESGEDVDFGTLKSAMERHLGGCAHPGGP